MKRWFGPKIACLVVACLTASAALIAPARATACSVTYTWTGVSSVWTNTALWTPTPPTGGPNGATVCVSIGTGAVLLNKNVQVLNGTVSGTAAISGQDARTLTVNGALSIANDNEMTGETPADVPVLNILNAATFTKSAGAGVTVVDWAVEGAGDITASSGVLELDAGTVSSLTGSIGGGTSTVRFSGGADKTYVLGSGATLSGKVSVGKPGDGATLVVADGATVTASGVGNVFDASTLTIGAGSTFEVLMGNTLTMKGGSGYGPSALNGPGTLLVDTGATLDIDGWGLNFGTPSSSAAGDATMLNVHGLAELTGGGYVAAGELTNLHVFTGGMFTIHNPDGVDDGGYLRGTSNQPGFRNDGAIGKDTGSGLAVIDTDVTGSGSVSVADGTLEIYGMLVSDTRTAALLSAGAFGTGQITDATIDGYIAPGQPFATTVTSSSGASMPVTITESTVMPPPNGYANLFKYTATVNVDPGAIGTAKGTIDFGLTDTQTGRTYVVFNYGRVLPLCTAVSDPVSPCVDSVVSAPDGSGNIKTIVTLKAPTFNGPAAPNLRKCCAIGAAALDPKITTIKPTAFAPASETQNLQGEVHWTGTGSHSLEESQHLATGNQPLFVFDGTVLVPTVAGTFQVNDTVHHLATPLSLKVPIQVSTTTATAGSTFALTWATAPLTGNCAACQFEVQFRKKAGSAWPSTWQKLRGIKYRTTLWDALTAADLQGTGKYQFRVRVHSGTKNSGWSPLPAAGAANITITA